MFHHLSRTRGCLLALAGFVVVSSWSLPAATTYAKPEEVGLSGERLKRIGEMVQRRMQAGDLSGAVTLVARRGRVAHLEPFGVIDIDAKKPTAKDSLFRIASMSKPVTAVAVLMLLEEGKLRLTDPVSRFVPEFKSLMVAVASQSSTGTTPQPQFTTVPAAREITIRDLLTHTSGLVSGGISASEASKSPRRPEESLADYVPRLPAFPLAFQPGTRWAYSPLAGFDTLGRIVEVASGQSFDRFLKDRLFVPLGMSHTAFVVPVEHAPSLAVIYQRASNGLQRYGNQNALVSSTYYSGAGGLISNAEDYFQFAQMLLDRGQRNGTRLLSPTSIDLMSGIHIPDSLPGSPQGRAFGLGVQVVTDANALGFRVSNGSYGWSGAYCTFFWIDPKEKMVTVFMTQSLPFSQEPSRDFENAVMQAIIE
jgi:CubicO group peptidase (beta-lactamase class C family)